MMCYELLRRSDGICCIDGIQRCFLVMQKKNTNINIEYIRVNDIRKVFEWHTAALFPVCFFHVPIPPCVDQIKKM